MCTISGNDQATVVVAAKTLSDDQAVKILEIVKNQTGLSRAEYQNNAAGLIWAVLIFGNA